jgi:Arabinose-binding domain of AraC transcription regulator, N-term
MVEDITRQVLPTATGFAARQAIALLRKRNIEVAPLLRRVGLSEPDLDNRQGRISANAQAKLLECAAEALGDSAFGLHLAQQANLREAGLLFYVTSAARTIGETLPLYERYCRIVNEAVRVKPLRIQNGVAISCSSFNTAEKAKEPSGFCVANSSLCPRAGRWLADRNMLIGAPEEHRHRR